MEGSEEGKREGIKGRNLILSVQEYLCRIITLHAGMSLQDNKSAGISVQDNNSCRIITLHAGISVQDNN